LARLFDFPGPEFSAQGNLLIRLIRESYPDAAAEIQNFLNRVPAKPLDLQELHTRTFDVQSLTTLDVGYVLFGDDYKRGALLAHLNQEHKRVENDCRGELADHLPNVLRLMSKLTDLDLLSELVGQILIPALILMIREFDPKRITQKNATYQKHYQTLIDFAPGSDSAIYVWPLRGLLLVLEKDFQMAETIKSFSSWSNDPKSADFLGLVKKEMKIEG
jgi:nitrate reductase assembly molybdenum cofactor insertion protein NarJ